MTTPITINIPCAASPDIMVTITANIGDRLNSSADVKQALTRAITAWIKNTKTGQKAYKQAGAQFNVGDLADWLDDKALRRALSAQGVYGIIIDSRITEVENAWDHDDPLFDRETINAIFVERRPSWTGTTNLST